MQWERLKDNRCPQCDAKIFRLWNENYHCQECNFYCKLGKARQILADLNQRNFDKDADEFLKRHKCYIPKY